MATKDFQTVLAESLKINERNDCAVKAVTILTGRPYEDVHDLFRRQGRKRGRRTPSWMTHQVLASMGYELRRIKRLPKSVNQCGEKLSKSGKFLIHTSRHVLAFAGGKVQDWTEGKRHRPKSIYRVVRKRKRASNA